MCQIPLERMTEWDITTSVQAWDSHLKISTNWERGQNKVSRKNNLSDPYGLSNNWKSNAVARYMIYHGQVYYYMPY